MQSNEIEQNELSSVDSRAFGLSSKIKIGKRTEKDWYIIIDRKSRIIMKDGERINDIIEAVKKVRPEVNIGLAALPAVCSKTTAYLSKRGIAVNKLKVD